MQKIKILIADDEALFRSGISFLIQREKNFTVIFEANNGEEVIQYLQHNEDHPNIILMDLKMPVLNGVEATKLINKYYPKIRVIALTSYNTNSFINNMIQVGASSYLVKNATPTEMLYTINEVAKKGFYYNELVMNVIQENITFNAGKVKSNFDEEFVTIREREVLHLICKQFSTAEIADKLFLSPRTVEGYRNSLLLKTESKNVAGLVVYAFQNGLIDIETF
jgi:DNA-binding NarL/FixJ family response regulator